MKGDAIERAPTRDRTCGPAIDRISPEGRAIFVDMLATIALARVLADLDAEDSAAASEHPESLVPGTSEDRSPRAVAAANAAPTRRRAR